MSELHDSLTDYVQIWADELEATQIFAIPLENHPTYCLIGSTNQENFLSGSSKDLLIAVTDDLDQWIDELIRQEQKAMARAELMKQLSQRQVCIVMRIANNSHIAEIAQQIEVSESTVRHELNEVYAALGIEGLSQLKKFALENNII